MSKGVEGKEECVKGRRSRRSENRKEGGVEKGREKGKGKKVGKGWEGMGRDGMMNKEGKGSERDDGRTEERGMMTKKTSECKKRVDWEQVSKKVEQLIIEGEEQ